MHWLVPTILGGMALVALLRITVPMLVDLVRGPKPVPVWYPKIARIRIAKIPCRHCGVGLEQNDLVVWFECEVERSMPAHASCAVFIKRPDGSITYLDGSEAPAHVGPGYLLLTEDEWDNWEKRNQVEVPARVLGSDSR